MADQSFTPSKQELYSAIDLLLDTKQTSPSMKSLPSQMPQTGFGEGATLQKLAPLVLGGAAHLGSDTAFAHMDPPTPWITWITQCWNASLNQNLLHPDVSPIAGEIEQQVVQWLCPDFGMSGGHLTPGSTVSNLTALWAARDCAGVKRVVASQSAHVSIAKAAHILGLELELLPCNATGQIDGSYLSDDLSDAALVLTAGTTSAGAIDSLLLTQRAAWTHVDAAWAGPLRFSAQHRELLDGIEHADSVAVSAHKWLFQPKECGVLLFKDADSANEVLSVSGPYLSTPNVGLLGSHGASAIPLLATLIAWGREGLAQRINMAMDNADALVAFLKQQESALVYSENISGVVLWRCLNQPNANIVNQLPVGTASAATVDETLWIRHVSANPNVDIDLVKESIGLALAAI